VETRKITNRKKGNSKRECGNGTLKWKGEVKLKKNGCGAPKRGRQKRARPARKGTGWAKGLQGCKTDKTPREINRIPLFEKKKTRWWRRRGKVPPPEQVAGAPKNKGVIFCEKAQESKNGTPLCLKKRE